MDGLNLDNFAHKDICDIKHKTLDDEVAELKDSIESVTNPSNGYLAIAVAALEKKIEKVDAKLNGLIIFYGTTMTGLVISIGGEFIKRFVK